MRSILHERLGLRPPPCVAGGCCPMPKCVDNQCKTVYMGNCSSSSQSSESSALQCQGVCCLTFNGGCAGAGAQGLCGIPNELCCLSCATGSSSSASSSQGNTCQGVCCLTFNGGCADADAQGLCGIPNELCCLSCATGSSSSGDGNTHLECIGEACTPVQGGGADLCNSLSPDPCGTQQHASCQGLQCALIQGPGPNLCLGDNDCDPNDCGNGVLGGNEECDVGLACPAGRDCDFSDCRCRTGSSSSQRSSSSTGDTHLECIGEACTPVQGGGADLCNPLSPDPCGVGMRLVCQSLQCAVIMGSGPNLCLADTECDPNDCGNGIVGGNEECEVGLACPAGRDCDFSDCRCRTGSSSSQRSSSSVNPDDTHLECIGEACAPVFGRGTDECNPLFDCGSTNHLVCSGNSCTIASGAGPNDCSALLDCGTNSHLACQNNSCVPVSGAGPNLCGSSADCGIGSSSSRSSGGSSQSSSLPPSPRSSTASSTGPAQTHLECRGLTCSIVPGAGEPQCRLSSDCGTVSHTVCQGSQCVTVPGAGGNLCRSGLDCVASICGNGRKDPGEACDIGIVCPGNAVCNPSTCSCTDSPACGNRRLEPGEKCDDGNTRTGTAAPTAVSLKTIFLFAVATAS